MKHLAAYLLLRLGGNDSPSAKDIKGVLGSVGIEADEDRLKTLLAELKGKDLDDLISKGSAKLASVPSGGGGGGGGAPAGGATTSGGDAPAEKEKEPEKEEEKEESDEDMGFGLFD